MAGFEVIIYGRFWVITEVKETDDALKLWKDNPVGYYLAGLEWEWHGDVRMAAVKKGLRHHLNQRILGLVAGEWSVLNVRGS
jgi:hypothetical protein